MPLPLVCAYIWGRWEASPWAMPVVGLLGHGLPRELPLGASRALGPQHLLLWPQLGGRAGRGWPNWGLLWEPRGARARPGATVAVPTGGRPFLQCAGHGRAWPWSPAGFPPTSCHVAGLHSSVCHERMTRTQPKVCLDPGHAGAWEMSERRRSGRCEAATRQACRRALSSPGHRGGLPGGVAHPCIRPPRTEGWAGLWESSSGLGGGCCHTPRGA